MSITARQAVEKMLKALDEKKDSRDIILISITAGESFSKGGTAEQGMIEHYISIRYAHIGIPETEENEFSYTLKWSGRTYESCLRQAADNLKLKIDVDLAACDNCGGIGYLVDNETPSDKSWLCEDCEGSGKR